MNEKLKAKVKAYISANYDEQRQARLNACLDNFSTEEERMMTDGHTLVSR